MFGRSDASGNYSQTRWSDKLDYDRMVEQVPREVKTYWAEELSSQGRMEVSRKRGFAHRPALATPAGTACRCTLSFRSTLSQQLSDANAGPSIQKNDEAQDGPRAWSDLYEWVATPTKLLTSFMPPDTV